MRKRHGSNVQQSGFFCFDYNCVITLREVQREDLRGSQIDLSELKPALAALASATKERVFCHTSAN